MSEEELAAILAKQWLYTIISYVIVSALVWGYAARLWLAHRAVSKRLSRVSAER